MTRTVEAARRLPEPLVLPSPEYLAMSALLSNAKHEVSTLGWITAETAMALNRYGVDAAHLERRLLDNA